MEIKIYYQDTVSVGVPIISLILNGRGPGFLRGIKKFAGRNFLGEISEPGKNL